ncbi:membrane protein of ER body-like protein isoform X2 [Cornus florida]|uniref:membrane protein of ER body-like protein isoform X2 n=1 Tax=Cornus florida TaxID=4283 RepID=UPI002898FBDE|nr:membrane protein of ER body-like protein isoform X2 [Cornus florida]
MEKGEPQWEPQVEGKEEEEEEEEEIETVEVALRGRRNRNRDNDAISTTTTTATTATTTTVTVTVSNGKTSESFNGDRSIIQEQQFKEEDLQFINEFDVQKGIEKEDGQQISERNVYYDQHQDAEPIHGSFVTEHTLGFSGTEDSSVQCSASERNPRDDGVDVTVKNLNVQRSLSNVTDHQYEQNLKDNGLSGFSHLPTENLSEEHNKSSNSFNNNIIDLADINLVKESHQEITELDIESVLEKQDTHDLYCPNCNSCITRRVILRKRKHKIRNPGVDAKRNKLNKLVHSELDSISAHATNDQGHDAVDMPLDDSTTPAAIDYNRQREPEIFRCLSCFSFFIPTTGNSFKSEKENTQNLEEAPVMNKNWFFSIFSSYKGETSSEQGSGRREDVENDNVGTLIPSFNLNIQYGQVSSVQEEPSPSQLPGVGGLVNGSTTKPQEGRYDVLPTSAQGPELLGKVTVDVGEKIDEKMKKGTGGAALDHSEVDNSDQLRSSSTSNGMLLNREHDRPATQLTSGTPVNIGEPAENVTLIPQQDGLKLLIPSDAGALIYEESKTDQKLNEAIEEKTEDGGNHFELSQHTITETKVFIHTEEPLKADSDALIPPVQDSLLQETQINVGKDSKDMHAESNADGSYRIELSQHTITGTKLVIHTEEPLKADRDVLIPQVQDSLHQEKQINIGKDSKDMRAERNADNDTIIQVEEPVEPAASQMAQTIITSAETGTMPSIETQIRVGDQKGIEAREVYGLDIIKSIVYGGLIESITSLGVVSSAAGADASTLNVLALGLANLIGGLFLIGHNLWDMKNDSSESASNQATNQVNRYQELLGRRENFFLHATVAVLSFLVFGILPPVVFGFSFRESDNSDYKLLAVAAASLLCIIILAIGKAYIQRPAKSYIKTVLYYVIMGFMASGVSYVVGTLIKELLEKLGLFQSSLDVAIPLLEKAPMEPAWRSSY